MAGVNKVILIGHLGKDPEIRSIEGGVKKASFSLATTEYYKNKNGERTESTEWHNVVLWRGLAELAENYLRKGSQVYLEGRIKYRQYDDKDGVKKYITEINGDALTFLGGGKGQQTPSEQPIKGSSEDNPPMEDLSDDLPF
ncbi:MAG: single-stranded DNA-binding protein [Bacteroidetes bacterium]|nr:single-stranded DNA-binding protein [Bacteroidota bacterium]